MMLWLFKPLHSLAVVVALQHLMILSLAIVAYRVMVRTLGVGRRWAAVATTPVLLDAYQIQLEHMLLSDALFTVLVFGAVMLLVRAGSPVSLWLHAAAGGLHGGRHGLATLPPGRRHHSRPHPAASRPTGHHLSSPPPV